MKKVVCVSGDSGNKVTVIHIFILTGNYESVQSTSPLILFGDWNSRT